MSRDDLDTETHRRDAEIVDSEHRPMRFIDRKGRGWIRRCWECELGLPSEQIETPECHKPDCSRRDEL